MEFFGLNLRRLSSRERIESAKKGVCFIPLLDSILKFLLPNLSDGASTTDFDQSTCQETLENFLQAFQKVMDLQTKVSKSMTSTLVAIVTLSDHIQAYPIF